MTSPDNHATSEASLRLHADFAEPALMRAEGAAWRPSPAPGVTRRMLDRIGGEVARVTSVVRYAPGARFPAHAHTGGEEYLVLSGVFSDATGDFGEGTYVRNPPGTSHAPWTGPGCDILVKLHQMRPEDDVHLRVRPGDRDWRRRDGAREECVLFDAPGEHVTLQRWSSGGGEIAINAEAGAEIYVLEGALETGKAALRQGDWLRVPAGASLCASARSPAFFWLKQGHLAPPLGIGAAA